MEELYKKSKICNWGAESMTSFSSLFGAILVLALEVSLPKKQLGSGQTRRVTHPRSPDRVGSEKASLRT